MIEVTPVTSRAERETFIRLPGRLWGDDPNWVEPLWQERRDFLSPKKNAFFEHAEVALWLARRGGSPVGRISAQVDRLAPAVGGRRLGYFGMLATGDDAAVLGALFATAESWLAAHGVAVVRGPFDFSINQSCGILVDGFDTPPALLMNHNPPWLGGAVEAAGYTPVKDLVCYRMVCKGGLADGPRRLAERRSPGLVIRRLDMRRYEAEVATLTEIFNDAWAENWGFTPLTAAETRAMAREMKPIIDPGLVQIAELHGEAVGFIVLLPDLNTMIADLHGRLLPFGWAKLLWRLKMRPVRSGRVALMGVRRNEARTLVGKILPLRLIYALEERGLPIGLEELELGWLLEDNWPVRRVVESVGGRLAKTYRIYEKQLA